MYNNEDIVRLTNGTIREFGDPITEELLKKGVTVIDKIDISKSTNKFIPTHPPVPFLIFFDFDGVLTDYDNEAARRGLSVKELKFKKDVFSLLLPLGEAVKKINELNAIYPDQIRFLTAASFLRPESWSEKVYWYKKYFPNFHKKLIITSDKGACGTESDILVDDNPTWNGADRFKGSKFKFKYTDTVWDEVFTFIADHQKNLDNQYISKSPGFHRIG